MAWKISPKGLELIKYYESCSLDAYLDAVKVPTIAWGRIRYDDGSPVSMGDSCTQAQADAWLLSDIEKEGSHYVNAWGMHFAKEQEQFDSMCSFVYNRGAGRYRELLSKSHSIEELTNNILDYDWAGSKENRLLGLQRRRRSEREMYLGGDWRKWMDWKP